jgi:hypothetical protein
MKLDFGKHSIDVATFPFRFMSALLVKGPDQKPANVS